MDLFTLNQEFRKFEILCGKAGMKNEIKNIMTVEVADAFRWLQAGDFVITKGYFSKKANASFSSFVEMLIEKRAAGLGIKLGMFIKELSPEIIALANENQFPILSVPISIKHSAIVSSVLHMLSSKKQYGQYILNIFQNDLNQLTKSAYQITDITGLLQVYLGYQVCLFQNKNFNWVVGPESPGAEAMKSWTEGNGDSILSDGTQQFISEGRRFSVFRVNSAAETIAFLAVGSGDRDLTSVDMQLVRKTLPIICVYLLSGIRSPSFKGGSVGDLYERAMFEKDELDLQQLMLDAERMHIDYNASRYVWIAEFPHPGRQERENFVELADVALNPSKRDSYCGANAGNLVFASLIEPRPDWSAFLRNAIGKLSEEIKKRYPSIPIYFGVSASCLDFGDLRAGYQNAEFSLKLGKQRHPGDSVYFYESFILQNLLDEMWDNPILKRIYSNIADRLRQCDSQKNTEFLKTLTEMANCGFNIKNAAGNMYLHRNTISQRMEKIVSMLGLNLNDDESRLAVQISVRLMEENPH
ncbi:MAG: PucR family transcriptional regulator ligand-binding domain-containing protein [Synergistaceae bacterium]|nr:PucR family transcriptional regulator ligand-binding domain-containing protein [Synergistaceae bacterium]